MSNRTVYTTAFRVSFPHLATAHAQNAGDVPKFALSMLFPKNGICPHDPATPSTVANIMAALDEVCMEEFKCDFATATQAGMGIQFPPRFKDGDVVFQKDAAGNPDPTKIAPETAGMWILSAKNAEPVGTVDPSGAINVAPASIYAGCWAFAQLEISAYTGKQGRVVVAKLINVQMGYNDTAFGGKAAPQSGTAAFAGRAVVNTNVEAGFGQGGAMQPVNPALAAPIVNPALAAPAAVPILTMNAGLDYQAHITAGYTDAMLVERGLATMQAPVVNLPIVEMPVVQPVNPALVQPVVNPAAVVQPVVNPAAVVQPVAAPTVVAAPVVVAAPTIATTCAVVMNAGLDYQAHITAGYTDAMLLERGLATPNYLNAQA